MNILDNDRIIINNLVGTMNDTMLSGIMRKIDCFLHSKVSLFLPTSGQCEYAVTPSHSHPAYSFLYYFQTTGEIIVEGKTKVLDMADGNCFVAISPDIPHQEIELDHFESYIAIVIEKDLFEDTARQYTNQIPVYQADIFRPHSELLGVLRCFMLEADCKKNDDLDLLDNANSQKNQNMFYNRNLICNRDLICNLALVITHLVVQTVISLNNDKIHLYNRFEVDRAIAFMNSHFSEKISLEDLATEVHRSIGHFSKIFKYITNMTPIDYLHMIRLQNARRMLISESKSITEIAIECGFSSSSYFSYCFMDKYKNSPSEFRQIFKKK